MKNKECHIGSVCVYLDLSPVVCFSSSGLWVGHESNTAVILPK